MDGVLNTIICDDMTRPPHYITANMPLKKDDLDSRRGHLLAHWDCLYCRFLGFQVQEGIADLDTIGIKSYPGIWKSIQIFGGRQYFIEIRGSQSRGLVSALCRPLC